MISVTRLNNQPFVLNADLIRTVEQNPDTIITLVTGEHIIVRESSKEIIARVIEYGRHLRGLIPPS